MVISLPVNLLPLASAVGDGSGERLLWVIIPIALSNLIAGLIAVAGFYFVTRRFISHEFPAEMQAVRGSQARVEADVRALAQQGNRLEVEQARLTTTVAGIERRLELLEDHGHNRERG